MDKERIMKDVIISIKGLIASQGDDDDIELITDGKYAFSDGVAEFEYMESELTGMQGTHTAFVAEPDHIVLTRTGTVTMQMDFREEQKCYLIYSSPFGAMTVGLDTHSIKNELGETGGRLEVKYRLELDRAYTSRNCFEINIREA